MGIMMEVNQQVWLAGDGELISVGDEFISNGRFEEDRYGSEGKNECFRCLPLWSGTQSQSSMIPSTTFSFLVFSGY